MSKKLTHDELISQGPGQASAPRPTVAPAATAGEKELGPSPDAFETFPAEQSTGERTAPFASREREYVAPPSNLPMTMTQAESKERNCTWQSQNPWDSETEAAPILAGTKSGTPSATPTAPRVMPMKQRDGNTVESAFSRLRKMGGAH
jgi:hypothetical protein